jgi:putative hemolysin
MQITLNPLVGIFLSLILIGFFQGLEIAFISANRLNIELRKKQGKRSGAVLSYFIDNPAKFIGTIIVVVNLLIVIYGLFVAKFLDQFWVQLHLNNYAILALDVIVAAILLLFVVFLFKAIFKANNDKIINNSFVIVIIQTVHSIFGQLANFFTSSSETFLNLVLNKKFRDTKANISKVDLEQFLEQSNEHENDNDEFDTELFENALSLSETKIRQCLIPRKEIISISNLSTVEEAKVKFIDTKLSKLIVYNENIDTIVGYIHQLDLFKHPKEIAEILLPIPAVPETMSASDLINKFTKDRKSIAWVVDEFGGTAGIVTMEDLLEELFGEIQDEYDIDELLEKQIAKDEYIFSGRLEIDYVQERYQLHFPNNESETLSGFIIQEHEAIPKQRERIIIGKYEFEVLNVSATRIEMVKLKVLK